jgi:hypothetical protein
VRRGEIHRAAAPAPENITSGKLVPLDIKRQSRSASGALASGGSGFSGPHGAGSRMLTSQSPEAMFVRVLVFPN